MKKALSMVLIFCIIFTPLTTQVQAETVQAVTGDAITVTESENQKSKLQKVVTAVKSKITIPKSLTEFDYYYYDGTYNSEIWQLTWSDEEYSKQISVASDSDGNILSYSNRVDSKAKYAPKYLKSELEKTATSFLAKIAPKVAKKVELVSTSFDGVYSGEYTYYFQRVENKIPMPDNSVTVSVNYETGKVTSVNINWLYNASIPDNEAKITKSKAVSEIATKLKMVLSYHNAYDEKYTESSKIKAFLAYTPDISYISVDAKSGVLYTTQNKWEDSGEGKYTSADTASTEENASQAAGLTELTEKELASIEELEGLISKQEAIKLVTNSQTLLLDENLKKVTASLNKAYDVSNKNTKKYVWNIQLSDPREVNESTGDTYRAYANATVDAKTGKILSFYASVPNSYDIGEDKWKDVTVKYNAKEARTIFEKFLKEQIPDRFNNSEFTENQNDYIVAYLDGEPVYGGYSFNYSRVNEGVTYSYNGIYGAVDGVTGKIYSYGSNWYENVTFESTKGAMSKEEAYNKYISLDGFKLIYEINTVNNTPSVRLVYRADIEPNMISPFTGKQLNYTGKEYKENSEYSYTDISSSKSKRSILLLADMGIGFEGKKYLPGNKITKGELETLLTTIKYEENTLTSKQKSASINRTDAVKRLINFAGLEKIAQLKNIYKVDFKDSNKISKNDIGYVALAQALNIVSGTKFRPSDSLTRAEAADMIINTLVAESSLSED